MDNIEVLEQHIAQLKDIHEHYEDSHDVNIVSVRGKLYRCIEILENRKLRLLEETA
jgi:hypothetical protein